MDNLDIYDIDIAEKQKHAERKRVWRKIRTYIGILCLFGAISSFLVFFVPMVLEASKEAAALAASDSSQEELIIVPEESVPSEPEDFDFDSSDSAIDKFIDGITSDNLTSALEKSDGDTDLYSLVPDFKYIGADGAFKFYRDDLGTLWVSCQGHLTQMLDVDGKPRIVEYVWK